MGMYDTVYFKNKKGEEVDIQFKNGDCTLSNFNIGDQINIQDGIYFGHEGAFVVFNGILCAAFDKYEPFMYDKWDGLLNYPEF